MALKSAVKDPRIVRQLNRSAIFESVRERPGGISRAEAARLTKLSRATVSAIVEDLLENGLIREAGIGTSRGGRRPTLLKINPDAGRVLGIDIGATHLLVVLADLAGRILAEVERTISIAAGPEKSLAQVIDQVALTLEKAGCSMADVTAIGVGVPGPVITSEGIVSAPPIMPGWDGFPIRKRFEDCWEKPISLDNDADLGALGEWAFGAGRGESNLVYIKIGTGIGSGILIDGQIYRGVLGTAGEIGHVTISLDGPPCTCGNYGCLEAMAGGRAIAQRALLAVKAGQRTILAEIDPEELTARHVAQAAGANDLVSQQVMADAGRHIGSAIASLINLLNPGLVVIGGGVSQAGSVLIAPLLQVVRERTMRASMQATRIAQASLGRRSTAMGAVSIALTKTFQLCVEGGERVAGRVTQVNAWSSLS